MRFVISHNYLTKLLHVTNNDTAQIVGSNIQALRTKTALTQDALAQYLGTSRDQVVHYEIRSSSVSSTHLNKLADLFYVEEYDLFEEDTKQKQIHLALDSRADTLQPADLDSIVKFKKVVRNYLNMKKNLCDG